MKGSMLTSRGDAKTRKRPSRSAHERALGLLSVRARSRRELRDRLIRAGYGAEETGSALDRLSTAGLIDDDSFARAFAEHAMAKGAADRAVRSSLRAKGVAQTIIDLVLSETGRSEEERAAALAQARAPRLRSLDPATAHRRLTDYLARRGYDRRAASATALQALAIRVEGPAPE